MGRFEQFGFMLVVLALGAVASGVGLRGEARTGRPTVVACYVALPALVFVLTFDRPLSELVSPVLLVGV